MIFTYHVVTLFILVHLQYDDPKERDRNGWVISKLWATWAMEFL